MLSEALISHVMIDYVYYTHTFNITHSLLNITYRYFKKLLQTDL